MEEELKNQEEQAQEQAEEAAPAEAAPEAQAMQPMDAEENGEEAAPAEEAAPEGGEAQAEAVAAQEAPAEQAGGAQEDKEEEEADKEEQKEQEENPGGAAPKEEGGELAGDAVNQEIARVAAEAGVENEEDEDKGDPDRAFDTLEDLKKLNGENNNADNAENTDGEDKDKDTNERVLKDRKAVMQLRKGNLYKAVIFAKMLENGENPAGEEQQLEQKQAAAGGGRFSRFLNNSKLDKAGKVLKVANAGVGLAGRVDSNFSNSPIARLVSRGNDVTILINSIRGIVKKLKAFKQNSTTTTKKAFAIIALISDFGMAISKGAAIAQRVFARRGWNGLAGAMGKLSSFSGMVGQIAALTNVSKSLKDLVEATAPIKKAQKEEEGNVEAVLKKYEVKVEPEEAAGQAEKGKDGKEKTAKASKSHRLRKSKALKEKVLSTLERPDVSAEDKAVLASYLGRGRILSKRKVAIANVATGLVTAALGLGATFSKRAASRTEGDAQASATKHAGMFGTLSNISLIGSTIGMHIAQKKVNKGPDEKEGSLIKEGLYGALHDLGSDDKYGLRKISATLTPKEPDQEKLEGAELVMKRYETATKQFMGSGVNFANLFKATDKETFKDSLVASL